VAVGRRRRHIVRHTEFIFSVFACWRSASVSLIFVEFTINVAMVLGIFLVVGMPLPFFFHGGSSMVTICVCLGLSIAIDRDSMRQRNRA